MTLELAGSPPPAPPPANLYQRLRALNNLPPPARPFSLSAALLQPPEGRT